MGKLVLVGLVATLGCGAQSSTADAGPPDAPPCFAPGDCPFGSFCTGVCTPVECHFGRYTDSTPDKPCTDNRVCIVPDGGRGDEGHCETFVRDCNFDGECPFGFRCVSLQCTLADCTLGTDIANYGPRPCGDPTKHCGCMNDGADLNGGRGQCIVSDTDCQ